jgi:RNA polymerase sigma-70 factor (ECF subfamily)
MIVQEVLGGKTRAFEKILKKYQREVVKIVVSKIPYQDTPEVTHDVFIRAFQSLAGYARKEPFIRWLRTIAYRTCYDYWRARYRNREIAESNLSEKTRGWLKTRTSDSAFSFSSEDASRLETREILMWALGRLKPADRMILLLVHFEGYSVRETAAFLGLSQANVKVRAYRARKKMKKELESLVF